jgi:hypothetical protein
MEHSCVVDEVAQWEFYVVSRADIEATGYKSIGMPTLRQLTTGNTSYAELRDAIHESTRKEQAQLTD